MLPAERGQARELTGVFWLVGRVRSVKNRLNSAGTNLAKYEDAVKTGPSNEYQARHVRKELGHYPKTIDNLAPGVRYRRHSEAAGEKAAAALKLLKEDQAMAANKANSNVAGGMKWRGGQVL